MANVTITQLPAAQALTGTELVPIVQNGQTVRTTTASIGGGGGSVSSVNVSGGSTGLTTSGGPITSSGTITLGGLLAVGSGGTNATTAAGARVNILPSYTGNANYVLRVNAGATDVEWSASGGGGGVVSVSGTANEIASSGGVNPVISLPSALTFTGKTIVGGGFSGGTIDNAVVGGTTQAAGSFTTIATDYGTILATPVGNNDIVNKAYADAVASGLTFHQNCDFATSDFLPDCTYNNGSSGVGATLTAISNGVLVVDSSTISAGNRILVKNQLAALQNGIYTVTQVGSVSTPFILTRATDYNSPGTTYLKVDAGDFILVLSGSTNANSSWVQTTLQPITIGVTSLVFVQFSAGTAIYSNGTGLNLSGTNVFSIANTTVTSGTYGSASKVGEFSVNAQGQLTGAIERNIAIAGSQITSGQVAIANGGTGASTASAAINALLPSQTSNNGRFLTTDGSNTSWAIGRLGTVESVAVASSNGFAGTVATSTTTPVITLSTSVSGVLKGNGTAISAATAGTDYQAPITLTTTGTSGAATFVGNTLNIPNYATGGGGSPGGSDTQVQFNNAGAFGGSTGLTWNGASLQVGFRGAVRFGDLDNSNYIGIRAPSVVGTNVTYSLPASDGSSGQYLSTDGSGNLSWASSAGSGTVTDVSFTGGIVSVATSTSTPALTVAGTSGGVVYFSASNTWASSAALAANSLVIGGGAGAAPSTITTGTGVVTALGVTTNAASGIVVKDSSGNLTTNSSFNGFTNVAASGTTITMTAASTPVYNITGSGGQVIQLPNATTLPNGAIFSFNNNQSSGSITVNNNSASLIVSVPSGGYVTVILLSNATSAGSWDRHDQTPSNVAWSTNTLDYSGSITSATWNGAVIAPNRGGTGVANNVSSTITISGAYGTTFTVSGTTALTLPTSGTLATLAGTETLTNKTLTNPTLTNYTETRYAATVTGNAITLDLANGTFQTITTMVGANAITLPALGSGKSLTVQILYASTPTTLTFATPSGSLKWASGTTPTPTLTNTKYDFYSFVSDGTNWYAIQTGANF